MNEIDADLGELGDFGILSFQRAEIASLRMFFDACIQRGAADALRQQSNELNERPRAICRLYDADSATPCS